MPLASLSRYVEKPLLLFSGRKFDLRQWVLVRSFQPLEADSTWSFTLCDHGRRRKIAALLRLLAEISV